MMNIKKLNLQIPKMYGIKHIHFIGIGGAGISGIAKILFHQGYYITGSDLEFNIMTKNLIKLGIIIYFYHHKKNILGSNLIVKSSAIPSNNIEIITAKKMNIPIISRGEMLSEIMRFRDTIVVSGTHGKTTTTGILANIYLQSNLDPTIINGGLMKNINSNAYYGMSRYLIIEGDESDKSFLHFKPTKIIITNIDKDHLHQYKGNFENLKNTFLKFLHNLPFYGNAILCIDDVIIQKIINNINRPIITYGFNKNANFRIINYQQKRKKSYFSVIRYKTSIINVILNVPGKHNALNATAAIVVAILEKIFIKKILIALKNFQGISRRFDFLGKFSLKKINGSSGYVILFDDYGHHPEEIKNIINTIRTGWISKRLIMIFQPHRYTRTRDLYKEFVNVLSKVDKLFILEIYAAGEKPITGITSKSLCKDIKKISIINPIFIKKFNMILKKLIFELSNNDIIVLQGAGDIKTRFQKLGIFNF